MWNESVYNGGAIVIALFTPNHHSPFLFTYLGLQFRSGFQDFGKKMSGKVYVGSVLLIWRGCLFVGGSLTDRPCSNLSWNTTDETLRTVSVMLVSATLFEFYLRHFKDTEPFWMCAILSPMLHLAPTLD
jgi:hypothetical protein